MKSLLTGLARKLGQGVVNLLATILGLVLLGAPFIAYAGGEQSLVIGTYIGVFGIVVAIIAAFVGIFRRTRGAVSIVLYLCTFAVGLWLWAWSVLYVGGTWGMTVVFLANLFLGIGVMALAVLDTLLHAQWQYLGEFIGLWVVMIVMNIGAALYGSSAEEGKTQPA